MLTIAALMPTIVMLLLEIKYTNVSITAQHPSHLESHLYHGFLPVFKKHIDLFEIGNRMGHPLGVKQSAKTCDTYPAQKPYIKRIEYLSLINSVSRIAKIGIINVCETPLCLLENLSTFFTLFACNSKRRANEIKKATNPIINMEIMTLTSK